MERTNEEKQMKEIVEMTDLFWDVFMKKVVDNLTFGRRPSDYVFHLMEIDAALEKAKPSHWMRRYEEEPVLLPLIQGTAGTVAQRKIVEFKSIYGMVSTNADQGLDRHVNDHLRKGWEIYGEPFSVQRPQDEYRYAVVCLVKYEDFECPHNCEKCGKLIDLTSVVCGPCNEDTAEFNGLKIIKSEDGDGIIVHCTTIGDRIKIEPFSVNGVAIRSFDFCRGLPDGEPGVSYGGTE